MCTSPFLSCLPLISSEATSTNTCGCSQNKNHSLSYESCSRFGSLLRRAREFFMRGRRDAIGACALWPPSDHNAVRVLHMFCLIICSVRYLHRNISDILLALGAPGCAPWPVPDNEPFSLSLVTMGELGCWFRFGSQNILTFRSYRSHTVKSSIRRS